MSQTVKHESQAQEITFETISASKEGIVLFAEILDPPMNLLGPELVRDPQNSFLRVISNDLGIHLARNEHLPLPPFCTRDPATADGRPVGIGSHKPASGRPVAFHLRLR